MSILKRLKSLWVPFFSNSICSLLVSASHFGIHAAAKSLQSCPTLCDPRDGSPPGSADFGILQARTLEWVFIILAIFQTSLLLHLLWWSVISDLWCFYCSCLGISFFGSEVFLKIYLCMYSFFGSHGSPLRPAGFFQSRRAGLLSTAVCGLLTVVASLVVEHGL